MSAELTTDYLKSMIFDAFKEVVKGKGIGVRECAALDNYAEEDELLRARALDVENHWWDYPDECKRYDFDYALSYNNRDGTLFHLPALMTAVLDGYGETSDISVYRCLCENILPDSMSPPHHGYKEYLEYLRSIDIDNIIRYFEFTDKQIHVVSLYLLWVMQHDECYDFFERREHWVPWTKEMHEKSLKHASPGDYTLTLEEAIGIVDENHRIVRDWFAAGGVNPEEWVAVQEEGDATL